MKIHELDKSIEGKRIRVTRVAPSQAEEMGYVDDTDRLTGQTGTVEDFVNVGSLHLAQLRVSWDNPEPGTLALAGEDEIEIVAATL